MSDHFRHDSCAGCQTSIDPPNSISYCTMTQCGASHSRTWLMVWPEQQTCNEHKWKKILLFFFFGCFRCPFCFQLAKQNKWSETKRSTGQGPPLSTYQMTSNKQARSASKSRKQSMGEELSLFNQKNNTRAFKRCSLHLREKNII